MPPTMYRQGDVVIRLTSAPDSKLNALSKTGGRTILTHGEATGHAHAIEEETAQLFEARNRL